MRDGEGLQVNVHVERASAGREVEDGMRRCAHPLSKVPRIGERDTARNDPRLDLSLGRDVPRPRDDDLVGRSNLAANHLDLVGDEEPQVLDILALPPSP